METQKLKRYYTYHEFFLYFTSFTPFLIGPVLSQGTVLKTEPQGINLLHCNRSCWSDPNQDVGGDCKLT